MRRKEKQIIDEREMEDILCRAEVCRIALSLEGEPYIFPVHYGYERGVLYFHSAPEGKKLDILRKNSRVCVEVETDVKLLPSEDPCGWGTAFRSVIGRGRAMMLEGYDEKVRALTVIMRHYAGDGNFSFSPGRVEKTAVVRIDLEEMTGKRSGY